jgi:GNAT superfamily N-acetyltransferase
VTAGDSASGARSPVTIREVPAGKTTLAWEALRELRPHLTDRDAFVRRVDDLQRPEGYRIVAAFEPGVEQARAAAGFRIGHNLAWGRFLYVDDLSTLTAARRRGYGKALLAWLAEEAGRQGCDSVELDSGVGPSREDAHRRYFASGMRISSHHFTGPTASPGSQA